MIEYKNGCIHHYKSQVIKQRYAKGYKIVSVCRNNKYEHFRVNRLVAIAFIPNPSNLSDVNHLDHDKDNNKVDNLEWLSQQDNTLYSYKAGKYTARTNPNRSSKLSEEIIKKIFELRSSGLSRHSIGDMFGISHVTVWRVLKDKHWVKLNEQMG